MKKVIEGKLYNTETAEELASWHNGCSYNDFNYCREVLYRTKKGNYFIYGEGGAMSKYSRFCGNNSWDGGDDIVPLTIEEAKEWAETHCSADNYCEIFGKPEEA